LLVDAAVAVGCGNGEDVAPSTAPATTQQVPRIGGLEDFRARIRCLVRLKGVRIGVGGR
jgi:hypothetical protein